MECWAYMSSNVTVVMLHVMGTRVQTLPVYNNGRYPLISTCSSVTFNISSACSG